MVELIAEKSKYTKRKFWQKAYASAWLVTAILRNYIL